MHKMLLCAMAIALATFPFLGGCSDDLKYVSDGDFKYCYIKDTDSYAIIGTSKQGEQKDVLYFPAYYKDKIVAQLGVMTSRALMGEENWYWFDEESTVAIKMYFPYTIDHYFPWRILKSNKNGGIFTNESERLLYTAVDGEIYFTNANEEFLHTAVAMARNNKTKYYVTPSAYEYIINDSYIRDPWDVYVANTSFLFNYENAPNKDYFFINNFDNGGLIEKTPYAPKRDGYTFDGWYKDPTCETAWNFMSDTLPQMQFDEEGKEIFQETRLYAKWIKN